MDKVWTDDWINLDINTQKIFVVKQTQQTLYLISAHLKCTKSLGENATNVKIYKLRSLQHQICR